MRRWCCGEMAGFDPRDSTSVEQPVPDYLATLGQPLSGLRIGLLKEFFDKGLEPEHRGAHPRGAARVRGARREAHRGEPAEPAAVGAGLLRGRARPSAPPISRASTACASGTAARTRSDLIDLYQPLARRGLRRRGEAPHHDRHLRALGRLLRRLLPEGAARAAADQRRLHPRLQGRGRAHRPDHADAGLRARRQDRRPDHHVPERHLHHRREPRRAARRCRFRAGSCRTCRSDCRWSARTSARRAAATWRTPSSARPTGTAACRRASHERLGDGDRARDPRPARHAIEDLLRFGDALRRAAERAGESGRPRLPGRAAGAERARPCAWR